MEGSIGKKRQAGAGIAADKAKAFEKAPAAEGIRRREGIVLLADDSQDIRETYDLLFGGMLRFRVAKDGFEAFSIFSENTVSLIVSDIHMVSGGGEEPGNGIWLVRRIREMDPHVHIVVVSGGASDQEKAAAISAGASEYVVKPMEVERLVSIINASSGQHLDRGR